MTLHNQSAYNHQALVEALKQHDLPHDTPSQVSDGFRLGWTAAMNLMLQTICGDTDKIPNMRYESLDARSDVPTEDKVITLRWLMTPYNLLKDRKLTHIREVPANG